MRDDQKARLEALAERLADVFLVEADPDNWSGGGKIPRDMSQQERGNRHWDRKGAMGTGGVLKYTLDLIGNGQKNQVGDPQMQDDRDHDLEAKIRDAESRAKKAVERVVDKAKKDAYDKAVHGTKS